MSVFLPEYFQGGADVSNSQLGDATYVDLDYFSSGTRTDIGDPAAATATIVAGIQSLSKGQDVDCYAFDVLQEDAGLVTLTLDIDGAASSGLDSYIWLSGPDFALIDYNDDSAVDPGSQEYVPGGTRDSHLTFTPLVAGTYYISVRSYSSSGTGNYTLHISQSGGSGVQAFGNGSMGGDALYGDANGDPIADTIHGYAGNDSISSGVENDTVYGGDGADSIDGGPGHDDLYGDDNVQISTYTYIGGAFEGPGDEDTLSGGDGVDRLYGGRGNDTLSGGNDFDDLDGGDGADLLDGGAASDRYFGGANDLDTDVFVIRKGETYWSSPDLIFQMEGAGAPGGDVIRLDKLGGPVFLAGLVGNDTSTGAILPGGGNGVNDAVYATYTAKPFIGVMIDVDDDGLLDDADIWFRVYDTALISPDDFATNQVIGPSSGDASDQSFTGTKRPDYILAGAGNDKVNGGGGVDLLLGEAGADKLFGEADGDSLDGGSENDRLDGGAGRDYLFGGTGRDVLAGGTDRDVLTGGAGADRFVYTALANTGVNAGSRDVITDFNLRGDTIDLSAIDALPGGIDNEFTFLDSGGFTAAGQVRVSAINARADTLVKLNTDGDPEAEATILLEGVRAARIDAGDFAL